MDLEEHISRTEILHGLRTRELIGKSVPLCDWQSAFKSKADFVRLPRSTHMFYRRQNSQIERMQEIDQMLEIGITHSLLEEYGDDIGVEQPRTRRRAPQTVSRTQWQSKQPNSVPATADTVRFWININMAANVVLLLGKIAVFILTDSLSMVASLVDSILDMLSTIIIFISSHYAVKQDWHTRHRYPVGRNRLEPLGVLVFSVIMIVSFMKVGDESIEKLMYGHGPAVRIGWPGFIIAVLTIFLKAVLWQLCRKVPSSSVQALAQDAETDTMFNFFSIIFPVMGSVFSIWQLDALGAMLLSIYVVYSWGAVAMEHIDNLAGAAADPPDREQILYLCTRFSERIKYITVLNAYHAGDRLMVEVDILPDASLSVRDSHDLAESLQYALETLPYVERAYVHVDYRRDNFSGHLE